jgi:hypothetical protein
VAALVRRLVLGSPLRRGRADGTGIVLLEQVEPRDSSHTERAREGAGEKISSVHQPASTHVLRRNAMNVTCSQHLPPTPLPDLDNTLIGEGGWTTLRR